MSGLAVRRAKEPDVIRTVICFTGCGEVVAPKEWRLGEKCPKCKKSTAMRGRNWK